MAPHSSTLAWKIPWTEEPGGLQSMGSRTVRLDWATSLALFTFMHLVKEMATHSSVLAWRIPGTGEPGGLPSMGSHRVGHDWSDLAAAANWSRSFLGSRVVKNPLANEGNLRHRFDPWVGKIPWSSELQPTPVFSPGKFHGQRSLMGYSPWGSQRVWYDWAHTHRLL